MNIACKTNFTNFIFTTFLYCNTYSITIFTAIFYTHCLAYTMYNLIWYCLKIIWLSNSCRPSINYTVCECAKFSVTVSRDSPIDRWGISRLHISQSPTVWLGSARASHQHGADELWKHLNTSQCLEASVTATIVLSVEYHHW